MLNIDHLAYTYRSKNPDPKCPGDAYRYHGKVHAGEVASILGESGSGKSTLLDLIAGFIAPDRGSITLDGTPLCPLPPERRPVTILFQNHNLFEHLTVRQNLIIGLHGSIRGNRDATHKANAILAELGIIAYADRMVTALSGGQQQRVALGRALLRERPILLLDEPFAGLDPDTRTDVLRLVRTLTTRRALHTVMVTHEPHDGDAIADRVYQMEVGTLKQVG